MLLHGGQHGLLRHRPVKRHPTRKPVAGNVAAHGFHGWPGTIHVHHHVFRQLPNGPQEINWALLLAHPPTPHDAEFRIATGILPRFNRAQLRQQSGFQPVGQHRQGLIHPLILQLVGKMVGGDYNMIRIICLVDHEPPHATRQGGARVRRIPKRHRPHRIIAVIQPGKQHTGRRGKRQHALGIHINTPVHGLHQR